MRFCWQWSRMPCVLENDNSRHIREQIPPSRNNGLFLREPETRRSRGEVMERSHDVDNFSNRVGEIEFGGGDSRERAVSQNRVLA